MVGVVVFFVVAQQLDLGLQLGSLGLRRIAGKVRDQSTGFGEITLASDQVGSLDLHLGELLGVFNFVQPRLGFLAVLGFDSELRKHQVGLRQASHFMFVFFQFQETQQRSFGLLVLYLLNLHSAQQQPHIREVGHVLRKLLQLHQGIIQTLGVNQNSGIAELQIGLPVLFQRLQHQLFRLRFTQRQQL